MLLQDLIDRNQSEWNQYQYHDFIKDLASSKLKLEAFKHYLIQDYIFLKNVGKLYALAIYKSKDIDDLTFFSLGLQNLLQEELAHHIKYCSEQGISEDELKKAEEEISTIAYTRYLLDIANSYSVNEILISLAPCIVGYYGMAEKIGKDISYNPRVEAYKNWIDIYKGKTYKEAVQEYTDFINEKIADIELESKEGERFLKIFRTAIKCEIGFFEQSYGKFHGQGFCLIRKIFG
ncbi:thiaminase II [Campylobacter blaseri]|uniref:Thiaminase-2/PQQC domain-containing protein n=1 Tax=Campylobacter blaseri TaxID=2042961 RepID=A0A2P8R0H1_9BACT|nr:TenA family protein [Campylobacter blaseri]PSM51990.1 hypothetical protein CQ405_05350 [Campylobacter blaseri]PSM53775.1 hypothetical protein CRN67_05350 [Campylobacter blaseri]QKF85671.1 thiaminase II [Campylobacter blaseri]